MDKWLAIRDEWIKIAEDRIFTGFRRCDTGHENTCLRPPAVSSGSRNPDRKSAFATTANAVSLRKPGAPRRAFNAHRRAFWKFIMTSVYRPLRSSRRMRVTDSIYVSSIAQKPAKTVLPAIRAYRRALAPTLASLRLPGRETASPAGRRGWRIWDRSRAARRRLREL